MLNNETTIGTADIAATPILSSKAMLESNWECPMFDFIQIKPKSKSVALVIPTLNEGARLHNQLRKMNPQLEHVDVYLSDAPSTDGSTDLAILRELGVSGVINLGEPGALSSSLRAAFCQVLTMGYESVILVDGNDKDDPEAIPRFIAELNKGADFVQGSRYIGSGQAINTPKHRDFLIKFVHAPLFSLICGRRFTDTTNGFRAFSSRLLTDSWVRPFRHEFVYYDFPYFLAWAACRGKFKVADIHVTRAYPASGPIPTKISFLKGNWRMFMVLLRLIIMRFTVPKR